MRTLLLLSAAVVLGACGEVPLPGGTKCQPTSSPGGSFCVPDGGGPAGQALKLEIVDQCQGGCGAELKLKCDVVRDGGTISLSLSGDVCRPTNPMVCPAVCTFTRFACDVPALPAGTYTVVSPSQPSQTLTVGDGGSATTCTASPF